VPSYGEGIWTNRRTTFSGKKILIYSLSCSIYGIYRGLVKNVILVRRDLFGHRVKLPPVTTSLTTQR